MESKNINLNITIINSFLKYYKINNNEKKIIEFYLKI